MSVPRCLTIATSDSGGGAGIQADLKAFAAAGCHGTCAVVGLTAQNTRGVFAVHEVPAEFVAIQLDAVYSDIGVDAAKTGALLSAAVVETVATFLASHSGPLVVDPVLRSSTGTALLDPRAVDAMTGLLLPLATVVTPNLDEATALAGMSGDRRALAERIAARGARAVLITGGHGDEHSDLLFDGHEHIEIPVEWQTNPATHGSGCTHSATLAAHLARGASLLEAARQAAASSGSAIRHGLAGLGGGAGPVDVLQVSDGASHLVRTR